MRAQPQPQPQARHYQTQQTVTPSYPRSRSFEEEEEAVVQRSTLNIQNRSRPTSYGSTGSLPQQEFRFKLGEQAQAGPRFVRKLAPYLQRTAGQPVKLEFEINDLPECRIRWYHNGKQVENGPHTRINSTFGVHTLIMPAVKADDAGSYKVIIESPLGNLETACDLVVEGSFHFCFFVSLNEVVRQLGATHSTPADPCPPPMKLAVPLPPRAEGVLALNGSPAAS